MPKRLPHLPLLETVASTATILQDDEIYVNITGNCVISVSLFGCWIGNLWCRKENLTWKQILMPFPVCDQSINLKHDMAFGRVSLGWRKVTRMEYLLRIVILVERDVRGVWPSLAKVEFAWWVQILTVFIFIHVALKREKVWIQLSTAMG